eukprot:gnl/TRDRNA2_/TRDRNA2_176725_c1_seq6.p1 gnl/TRDRNA2_/TRDRNA2_176725_c1~~gnl/TRDRNA2_/TRDRNA2_176725_c1_seq6.p1  ORF type:complete len:119 (-),score=23.28 gnl/TRDRNA2_/TRDRNA2_176725_c1_seq6:55-411(-)
MQGLVRQVQALLSSDPAETTSLALTVWAMAKMLYEDEPLLHEIASSSLAQLEQFEVQSLSNTVWSFARFLRMDAVLLHAAAVRSAKMVNDADPQDISNIAWAYARLRISHMPLMDSLS